MINCKDMISLMKYAKLRDETGLNKYVDIQETTRPTQKYGIAHQNRGQG